MKQSCDTLIDKDIHLSVHRIAVIKYLRNHHTHPTVDDMYAALNPTMPTLSKTTIYNTLKLFAEKGAISVITIDPKNTRYDANTCLHAHFQCERCGTIFDMNIDGDIRPSKTSTGGFEINETQVYFKGLCPKCKSQQQ